jgi:hypothetical protein
MYFKIIGDISHIETIATSHTIRDLALLQKQYGEGRWRKLKGVASVELANGHVRRA